MSQPQQPIAYFTEEGLKKLKDELHFLKTQERISITKQIAEARDKGDLSENAEYDAAREAQGMLEARIAKMEDTLSNARLRDASSLDTSKVSILTKVKIKNLKNKQVVEYTLVTQSEANLKEGKISVDSPIGKGLMGKKVGDKIDITVPAGVIPFEIVAISI
jgi:transcription elongation factor GreA